MLRRITQSGCNTWPRPCYAEMLGILYFLEILIQNDSAFAIFFLHFLTLDLKLLATTVLKWAVFIKFSVFLYPFHNHGENQTRWETIQAENDKVKKTNPGKTQMVVPFFPGNFKHDTIQHNTRTLDFKKNNDWRTHLTQNSPLLKLFNKLNVLSLFYK